VKNIPEMKILTRLPAKSICRFKSVSKRWNSIICNPKFIVSYIYGSPPSWSIFDRFVRVHQDAGESKPEFKVQWKQPPNVSNLSVNPHRIGDNTKEFNLESGIPPALVFNSSNGLLLISIKIKTKPYWEMNSPTNVVRINTDDSLYVVNPVTNDWVSIPIAPVPINRQGILGFMTQVGPTGILERFMIVDYQPLIVSCFGTLVCFRSETWKWEQIPANYLLGEHIWKGKQAHEFDGHLLLVDPTVGIIAWDEPFGGERNVNCQYIALPTLSEDWVNRRCIDVSGGHVQFLEVAYEGNHKLKLWRLNYEVGEWSLVHELCFNDVWSDPR
ncbi:F-box protein At1g49990, partial [Spinacia oleracea]|uniref:F-box protein At1g49990 n=1 Tax=Spinacia oleracea TaxID=3562 RepID=A0ABM3QJF8_SPIOL